jgi:hypothetical protein
MKIEFKLKEEDYKNALVELIYKEFKSKLTLFFFLSLVLSVFLSNKNTTWKSFLISYLFSFCFIVFLLFWKKVANLFRTIKLVRNNPNAIGEKSVVLEEDGFYFDTEIKEKNAWNSILKMEVIPNYILIILSNFTSITINIKELKQEEIIVFSETIEKHISKNTTNSTNKKKNIYWLGIVGFLPNIGIIVGTILIYLGIKRKDNKLKIIGVANVLFTPLFWIAFMYYMNYSGISKKANIEFTNHYLNEIVKDLEYYKSVNGNYPSKLEALKKQNKFFVDTEFFKKSIFFNEKNPAKFYYKKLNDDYILKSFGPDMKLNTKDDIFPTLKSKKINH